MIVNNMLNANGILLESDIYFNDTVNVVIERLEQYQKIYTEYDWLQLENNGRHGYCLVGYVRCIKEHDIVVLNCELPHTNFREGDEGEVIRIGKNNMLYDIALGENRGVHTVTARMIRKR